MVGLYRLEVQSLPLLKFVHIIVTMFSRQLLYILPLFLLLTKHQEDPACWQKPVMLHLPISLCGYDDMREVGKEKESEIIIM